MEDLRADVILKQSKFANVNVCVCVCVCVCGLHEYLSCDIPFRQLAVWPTSTPNLHKAKNQTLFHLRFEVLTAAKMPMAVL
jgi:hypothetical protein